MKKYILAALMLPLGATMHAQSPVDAYQLSQPDLRGTARFMSMGGAFGALGADLSTLSQNPAGIGVYRSSDIGFTLDLNCERATSDYQGYKQTIDKTKFYLDNIGIVGTLRLNSSAVPNINLGFTYNHAASFNRHYKGGIPNLKTSLSNYIAGIANNYDLTEADVKTTDNYDPYNSSRYVPWSAILGYDAYLIDPEGNPEAPDWYGQFGEGTTGRGSYEVKETGGIDEYNIAIGGNFANTVYWGMNFGITNVTYDIRSVWGEDLQNAYVFNPDANRVQQMDARWSLDNLYGLNGNGFNYSLGVIVKPIQELRLGLAFHTPTWYSLTENFAPEYLDYSYPFTNPGNDNYAVTDNEQYSSNDVNLRTPWKVIASVAGVFGSNCIVSFDYEWTGYKNMKYTDHDYYYGYDNVWNGTPSAEEETNRMINKMYKNSNTFRVGAEYRVLPSLSLRAGYSFTSSPVSAEAKDMVANVPTSGTLSSFRLDNDTHFLTFGLGYRYRGLYVDAAYMWKHQTSDYYPFAPDPSNIAATAMIPKLCFNQSRVVLSLGYRF